MLIWNLCAFVGTSIFAVNVISMKILTDFLPAILIIFMRFSLAGIFLFLLLISRNKKISINSHSDLFQLFVTALFGISLHYYLLTSSLQYISAPLVSLICSLIPLLTLLINSIVNQKRAKKTTVSLFALSIFGVYLVLDIRGVSDLFATFKGFSLMFLGVIAWVIYTMKVEYLLEKYDAVLVLAYQCIFGSFIISFFALEDIDLLFGISKSEDFILIAVNIIFVSLIATALGYLLYNLSIKNLGVTLPSLYMNTMPIITLIVSYFLLNSSITYRKLTGVMIVIISAVIVTIKENTVLNKSR